LAALPFARALGDGAPELAPDGGGRRLFFAAAFAAAGVEVANRRKVDMGNLVRHVVQTGKGLQKMLRQTEQT